MDAVRAWLQDRKNLPIVLAGTIIVLVVVGLMIWRMGGGGKRRAVDLAAQRPGMPGMPEGPGAAPGMPGAPTVGPAAPGMPGAPTVGPAAPGMPGVPPMAPGMPGVPPMAPGMPGVPTAVGTAVPGAPPVAVVASAKLAPMLPYRKDPFLLFSGKPTKKTALEHVLRFIPRVRLTPPPRVEPLSPEDIEALPPQPYRRMAGVMWNGKVSAILETGGVGDIVRPGMELTRGYSRVRVESIHPDYIILKTLDTRTPMTVKVNMAGAITTGAPGVEQPGYGPGAPPIYPAPGGPIPPSEGGMPPAYVNP